MKDTTTARAAVERPWLAGIVLIAIGTVLLVVQLFQVENAGWLVLGAIAAAFVGIGAYTRAYGWFIPGSIVGGLAVGVGLEAAGFGLNGAAVVLGLAGGFLAIYVINTVLGKPERWWPLIPGGILGTVGLSDAAGSSELGRWWPAVLIAVGLLILFANIRGTAASANR